MLFTGRLHGASQTVGVSRYGEACAFPRCAETADVRYKKVPFCAPHFDQFCLFLRARSLDLYDLSCDVAEILNSLGRPEE